jgi:alpha-tubulin suppressor-like RCC1 family protein
VFSLEHHRHELIPKELAIASPVKMVTCGKEHTLLLTQNGNVYSFGAGRYML